jgi:hypothetical protein
VKNAGAAKESKSVAPVAAEASSATGSTKTLIVMVLLALLPFGKFLITLKMARMVKKNRARAVWGMRRARETLSI